MIGRIVLEWIVDATFMRRSILLRKYVRLPFHGMILCALGAVALPGCSGVESEPVGAPTPEVEYELTEEELNAEQRR